MLTAANQPGVQFGYCWLQSQSYKALSEAECFFSGFMASLPKALKVILRSKMSMLPDH